MAGSLQEVEEVGEDISDGLDELNNYLKLVSTSTEDTSHLLNPASHNVKTIFGRARKFLETYKFLLTHETKQEYLNSNALQENLTRAESILNNNKLALKRTSQDLSNLHHSSLSSTLQMFCMLFLKSDVCQPNPQTTLSNFNSLKPVIQKRQFNAVFTVFQNGFLQVFVCNF